MLHSVHKKVRVTVSLLLVRAMLNLRKENYPIKSISTLIIMTVRRQVGNIHLHTTHLLLCKYTFFFSCLQQCSQIIAVITLPSKTFTVSVVDVSTVC